MADNAEPITMDYISSIWRMEEGSKGKLANVRKDLYPATARYLASLKDQCNRLLAEDIDSFQFKTLSDKMADVKARFMNIVDTRLRKIALMAIRNSQGSKDSTELMTKEELDYYDIVLQNTLRMRDLVSGKKKLRTLDIEHPFEPVEEKKPEPEPVTETETAQPVIEKEPEPVEETPLPEPVVEEEAPAPEPQNEKYSPEEEEEAEDLTELEQLVETRPPEKTEEKELDMSQEFTIVRIVADTPPFSCPERNYNLVKEDVVRLPTEYASMLISAGFAEAVIL